VNKLVPILGINTPGNVYRLTHSFCQIRASLLIVDLQVQQDQSWWK